MEGENFTLIREFVDDGDVVQSNLSSFHADCLYDGDSLGVLTHIESFLLGCGFVFDGHLAIVKEEE
jgi:hypothetical protein